MSAAELEHAYPLTFSALRSSDHLPSGIDAVVCAGVHVRVVIGEPGSLRRVDCWSADSGFVIHPFAGDPDRPSETTLLAAEGRLAAIARLVGGPGLLGTVAAFGGDVPVSAHRLVEHAAERAATPGESPRVVCVEDVDSVVDGLVVVHDGGTRWARSRGDEPVELVTGAYDGLWSAVCELFRI